MYVYVCVCMCMYVYIYLPTSSEGGVNQLVVHQSAHVSVYVYMCHINRRC
jgi:hypothetical protein